MSPLGAHGSVPQRATGGTDTEVGLSTPEAQRRLHAVGPNQIADHRETPLWRLALAQFKSLVVLLLLAGAGIAAALGEGVEAVAILVALLLNAAIGFLSEWRARVSLARLRALAVPHATVRRDGLLMRIAAAELVPGDVVLLEAGAAVPADARLLQSAALQVDESALTGESAPVWKDAQARPVSKVPLPELRPSSEFEGYRTHIFGRIGAGAILSIVASALIGWGIPVPIQGETFATILRSCSASPRGPCTGFEMLFLLGVPMGLGFSERLVTHFEGAWFGQFGRRRTRVWPPAQAGPPQG